MWMIKMATLFSRWTVSTSYVGTYFLYLVIVINLYAVHALADKNNNYHIDNLCHRKRSQQLYKKIDGAVLSSENEDNLDCLITFQTDSVLQKFLLRFEELKLDCNDHLYIFDGAHAYGNYKVDLSCRNNEHEVGTIYTMTNFVTLKYVTDGWGHVGNGFKLILTAFKDTPLECRGFRCQNNLCIHHDLTCDRVNHCGDGSDESSHAFCLDEDMMGQILGLGVGLFIIVVVITFIGCFACASGVAILFYRRQRRRPTGGHRNAASSYPFLPKATAEENAYEKPKVMMMNPMNSVSVFHSAAGLSPSSTTTTTTTTTTTQPPSSTAPASYDDAVESRGKASALSGKPLSPNGRDRLQSTPGKPLLSNKMKNSSSRSQKKGNPQKGEWLV